MVSGGQPGVDFYTKALQKMPVLLLWGAEDGAAPGDDIPAFKTILDDVADKRSEAKIFPGEKHLLPFERPIDIAQAVAGFIRKIGCI